MKGTICAALIFLLSSVLIINGCKKTVSVNGQIKSYYDALNNGTVTADTTFAFTYDGQGRLTELIPGTAEPITFYYGTGSVTQTQGAAVITYQLNAQGFAAYDNLGNTYIFDNNGYCTNITNTSAKVITDNVISGGNLTSRTITVNAGTGTAATTTYTYQYGDTTDYRITGENFLGKSSMKLLISETVSTPTTTTTFTYSYTFDSQGRVHSQTMTGGTINDVKTYTYED